VSWHSFRVFKALGLFAPVAFFAAFEVVVLALATLPATFRELEVSLRGWWTVAVRINRGARASGAVVEQGEGWLEATGLGDEAEIGGLGDLWGEQSLHGREEGLGHWGLLISIEFVVSDLVYSGGWLSPNWVLCENRFVLLWLMWLSEVLNQRIEGWSRLVEWVLWVIIYLGQFETFVIGIITIVVYQSHKIVIEHLTLSLIFSRVLRLAVECLKGAFSKSRERYWRFLVFQRLNGSIVSWCVWNRSALSFNFIFPWWSKEKGWVEAGFSGGSLGVKDLLGSKQLH
jgi:hypothetical protein